MEHYYTSFIEMENFQSFYTPKLYSDRTFGLDIYKKLTAFLALKLSQKLTIETRFLYTLKEHKKFMNLKINYIEQEGHYLFPDVFKDNYLQVEKETTIMLNQFLKHLITQKEININELIDKLHFLYQLEKEALETLLADFTKQGIIRSRSSISHS